MKKFLSSRPLTLPEKQKLFLILRIAALLLAAFLAGNLLSRFLHKNYTISVSAPTEELSLPQYGPATALEEQNVSNPYDPITAVSDPRSSGSDFFAAAASPSDPEMFLAPSTNWGLSFPEEGKRPAGSATIQELAPFHAHYAADTEEKVLYLTFDAGYENGNTEPILDALEKHNAPATFFVVGTYIERNPDLVRRMCETEAISVGNHTYSHPDMSKLSSRDSFSRELTQVEELYRELTGESMAPYYRPPQGIYSEENLTMARELGYHTFFWSLAYVDWQQDNQPTKEAAFDRLLKRVHPGAIVLLHSTSSTNAAILDELLTRWEEMGYRFAPLSDLTA